MKKKLLLAMAMIAALVCILAISVSATTYYKDADGNEIFSYEVDSNNIITSYEGSFPKTDDKGNALTWYVTGTATEGTDIVKTVISFVTTDTTYATVSESGQYTYNKGVYRENVVSANFPEGITSLNLENDTYGWKVGTRNLLFIYFPSTMTEMESRICQTTPVIVCEFHKDSTFPTLGDTAFYDCRNLREIFIPDSVTKIGGYDNYVNSGSAFYNCLSLSKVTFENVEADLVVNEDGTSNALTLTGGTFAYCTALTSVTLPNRTISVGPRAFEYATSLKEIRFGSSLVESVDVSTVHCCPEMRYYYIPATWTTVCNHTFSKDGGFGPNDRVFFYAGTKEQFDTFMAAARASGNNHRLTDIPDANIIEWDSTKDDQYYKDLATDNNCGYVVYGYSACDAFYSGNHINGTTISYESYDKDGEKTVGCVRNGCNNAEVTVADALFSYIGYSSSEYASGGIVIGFTVNATAINEYTQVSGKTLKYGLFAVSQLALGDNAIINADASTANGVVSVDMTNGNLQAFELKITGFETEAQKSAKLAVGAYVIAGDEVSYLQEKEPNEGESYYFASYNDIYNG